MYKKPPFSEKPVKEKMEVIASSADLQRKNKLQLQLSLYVVFVSPRTEVSPRMRGNPAMEKHNAWTLKSVCGN